MIYFAMFRAAALKFILARAVGDGTYANGRQVVQQSESRDLKPLLSVSNHEQNREDSYVRCYYRQRPC